MLGHKAKSSIPMHPSVTQGTKTPVHPKPSHQTMAGNPSMPMDHPAGGGGMPLPQGGPGGQPMPMAPSAGLPHMPITPRMPMAPKMGGRGGGRGGKGGY